MNARLQGFQRSVIVFHVEAIEVFEWLCKKFSVALGFFLSREWNQQYLDQRQTSSQIIQRTRCTVERILERWYEP